MQDEFYLGWKIMLCGSDVESVVISYLEPWCLASFFVECGLDFGKKFMYDARKRVLGLKEINEIFGIFPGIILMGLSVYDDGKYEIVVPLGKLMFCEIQKQPDCYSDVLQREVAKMVSVTELKLIDYEKRTKFGEWVNVRKLTIKIEKSKSSPYLNGISRLKKLNTLKLLNFEFCMNDFIEMSKCENLVNLEIDELIPWEINVFAQLNWNINVLKLGHCAGLNLNMLMNCPNVKCVEIKYWDNLMNITTLAKCTKLERVTIGGCPKLKDVSILGECVGLKKVIIRECPELEGVVMLIERLELRGVCIKIE